MKIGFFDSGLGGLLLLKEVARVLPDYDYVYYGDTAHLPYGDKTESVIYDLTKSAITDLLNRDCALVVVACNTASAETVRKLQDNFLPTSFPDRKVLGVIVPTLEELALQPCKRAILLATKRTVESNKYYIELQKIANSITLLSIATPELVPLIETDDIPMAVQAAAQVLISSKVGEGDVVILGCTHYVLLKTTLRELFPEVCFLSQDEIIPKKLQRYLEMHPEIRERLSSEGRRDIVLTEHKGQYDELIAKFLKGAYLAE